MITGIPEIKVNTKDLYQLLIGNLRYAYTRNNHLMPSSAFDQTLRILKDMLQAYPKEAVMTAKQICEECISLQIMENFSKGIDDEYQNLEASRKFVNDLLDLIHTSSDENALWYPYNFDLFLKNLELDDSPRYRFYNSKNKIIADKVSENDWLNTLCRLAKNGSYVVSYRREKIGDNKVKFTILKDDNSEDKIIYRELIYKA